MKIVITGVTRGLGRALAEEFIRLGHIVGGCGRGSDGILDMRRRKQGCRRIGTVGNQKFFAQRSR